MPDTQAAMMFDTKIVVVLRDDLADWQKLNVTAFTVSGIAGTVPGVVGEDYVDGSGNHHLPMFVQPVLIYSAESAKLRTVYERTLRRGVRCAIFTEELFTTGNDIDNRAAVLPVPSEQLNLVGLALRAERKIVDKIVDGVPLHR